MDGSRPRQWEQCLRRHKGEENLAGLRNHGQRLSIAGLTNEGRRGRKCD